MVAVVQVVDDSGWWSWSAVNGRSGRKGVVDWPQGRETGHYVIVAFTWGPLILLQQSPP